MTRAASLCIAAVLVACGCASTPPQRIGDIKPNRVYHKSLSEVFEAIRMYSYKEGFRLDRYGEEAGRIIGHKNTTTTSEGRSMSSIAETAEMVVMVVKLKRLSESDTEVLVNFSFENGHVVVSREDESILLDCYNTFLGYMDDQSGA
jgi:hypothetical protein